MINFLKIILLFLLTFNFIYPIRLSFFPNSEIFLYLLTFLFGIRHILNIGNYLKIPFVQYAFLSCFLLAIFGLISLIYNVSNDMLVLFPLIKLHFSFFLAFILVKLYIDLFKEQNKEKIYMAIIVSGIIVAVTCIFEFFSPNAKVFFATLIDTSGNIEYENSFRVHGIATGGGAALSIGILITALIAFIVGAETNKKNNLFFIIFGFILYASTILIGRSGFFLGAFFLLLYFIFNIGLRNIAIFSVASFASLYLISILDQNIIDILYRYSLEPIRNYLEFGELTSKTTSAIQEMYFLPSVDNFFLGSGFWRYPPSNLYIIPDPGYMKVLMSYGFFGFIVFYLYQVYFYFTSFRISSKNSNSRLIYFFIFIALFIMEAKEHFFTQNYAFKIILLVSFANYFKLNTVK